MNYLNWAAILSITSASMLPATDSQAANAQEATVVDGAITYPAETFERFAPKTALDMVRQIPGFSIDVAEEKRGLGQGGDNVLINGARITGKSNDAITALTRISASSVIRIEILDGATLDVPGLTGQVVNIISKVDNFGGQFRWSPEHPTSAIAPVLFDGELSVSGKTGTLDYAVSLTGDSFRNGNSGYETARNGNSEVFDRRYEKVHFDGDRPSISTTLKNEASNGNIANLNLSYERNYFEVVEDSFRFDRERTFQENEKEWSYEIGGDYTFGLGAGSLKLIGLHTFEHSDNRFTVTSDYIDARPSTGDRFERTPDEMEAVARAEYNWKAGNIDWQASAELAYNSLENKAELSKLDPSGNFIPVPLPGANATVEERRGEVALTFGRPLSSELTLQTSIGGEYSRLSQDGTLDVTRSFFRPKGYASIAWKASPRLDVNARIAREVGQLDFSDFLASSNVSAGNQNAANPDLVPQQSWRLDVEASRKLGEYGTITAKVFAEAISDIVDQVPIGDTGEAQGNLDSATVYGLEWNSTFNFDPFGWKGAKLDLDLVYRDSSVEDPLTGLKRRINQEQITEFNAAFRQDIPNSNWAYGASYRYWDNAPFVRLGEIGEFRGTRGDLGLFIENKNVLGLTLKAGIENVLDSKETLTRTAFVGRRDGPVLFREDRSRTSGLNYTFEISGSF